ncbi:DUF397 domain-containing protein [Streptomyces sp. NPDC094038]|uniref:DUF397 domain-containing protein n=1 Tax=Streptomyces sp. NPDC094038 TaxID=3366055 RepID=UPI00380300D6
MGGLKNTGWRKSSHSGEGDGDSCAETATTPTHTSLRDSKAPVRATLTFPTPAFAPSSKR